MNELEDAFSLFKLGLDSESNGDYNEALLSYRKAIKINPSVEKLYYSNFTPTDPQIEPPIIVHPQTTQSRNFIIQLDAFPREIKCCIIRWCLLMDFNNSFINLILVSKNFNLLATEQSIFKALAYRYHPPGHLKNDFDFLAYGNDWRRVFEEKPRLKFNGVFISQHSYLRTGYADTFNQPMVMVTYFRYLRLFSDKTCLFLTTPLPPKKIVKLFSKNISTVIKQLQHQQGLMTGSYEFDHKSSRLLMRLTDVNRKKEYFEIELLLKGTKFKFNNNFSWIRYGITTKGERRRNGVVDLDRTMSVGERGLKNFFFSRVKFNEEDEEC